MRWRRPRGELQSRIRGIPLWVVFGSEQAGEIRVLPTTESMKCSKDSVVSANTKGFGVRTTHLLRFGAAQNLTLPTTNVTLNKKGVRFVMVSRFCKGVMVAESSDEAIALK